MASETCPPRELTAYRDMRQAVGRQMTRTVFFCALSLAAGIGIGHYFLQKQMQVQQGVVSQLQREIRGLTGDIQRLELESSRQLGQFANLIDRLEQSQQRALASESRSAQQRLASVERLIGRHITATRDSQSVCLAEFAPYQQQHLAVPVEDVAGAIERMASRRLEELTALQSEIESHCELERARAAAVEGAWLLGSAAASEGVRASASDLSQPVSDAAPNTAPVAIAESAAVQTSPEPPTLEITIPDAEPAAVEITGDIPATVAKPVSVDVDAQAGPKSEPIAQLIPVPDHTVPPPRALVGAAGHRRPFGQLISFASGRVIEPSAPLASRTRRQATEAAPVATTETPIETAHVPTEGETR